MFETLLAVLPPWIVIVPLVGAINGALFFLIVGRRPSSLPVYLALAVAAAAVAQAVGIVEPSGPPLSLGEVHLVATSGAAWATLMVSRAIGL